MPGPTSAATKPRPTRNTPSTTRPTAVRADRWLAGGHRPVQPIAGAGTARSVPRLAGRHGAARQPGPDGLSVLLAGEIAAHGRSEEHTSELQSLMRISYAVFCLKKKTNHSRDKKIQPQKY